MSKAVAPAMMATMWGSSIMLPRAAGQTSCACVSRPQKLTEGASQRTASVSGSGVSNFSHRCAERSDVPRAKA